MSQKDSSEEFRREWEASLIEQGHKVETPKGISSILQSRNGEGKKYRWLLLIAQGKSKTLNKQELEDVKYHWDRSRRLRQKAYVVIRFQRPECKVIVLPAERVLQGKHIRSQKGGIPWNNG